jgi:NitT/TauT family transport system permease protein
MATSTTVATPVGARPTGARVRRHLPGRRGIFNLTFLLLVVAAWQGATMLFNIQSLVIPPPFGRDLPQTGAHVIGVWDSYLKFQSLIITSSLYTLHEALVGFLLAVVIGVGLSVVIVYSPFLRQIVMTTLVGVNSTPKVAVAPILIIWLGTGASSKYAMAFLLSFFPIVINTTRGLNDVPNDLLNLYKLMQASSWQVFRKVRLPNALPAMFDGFKIALPIAMIGAIVGEFVAARQGIGYQITIAYSNFNSQLVWAMIITVAILSLLMFQILIWLEDRLIFWRPSRQTS